MSSLHFKNSVKALSAAAERAGLALSVYDLLNLTDHLITARIDFCETAEPDYKHEVLVSVACKSAHVLQAVQDTEKITAVKELRTICTSTGVLTGEGGHLASLKRAIEDSRVEAAAALWSNPWVNHHDSDEPPF